MADGRSPCSVVLEGGVTSAVIYARLLAELAVNYSFRQLGGTSSGAVAAAAAAAAEFGRQHPPPGDATPADPFKALSGFPQALARLDCRGRTTLFKLFQPGQAGRRSFATAMDTLDRQGGAGVWKMAWRFGTALLLNFWPAALLALVALAALGYAAASGLGVRPLCGPERLWACAAGALALALPALVVAALAVLAWALWRTVVALRGNHWGLCSGMDEAGFAPHTALTPTLHGFFQGLAGRGPQDSPLSFGELWWGREPTEGWSRQQRDAERRIDLQIVSSAVSQARPVRLPGDAETDPLHEFFYDPGEWSRLFPPPVMAHLATHARAATLRHADGRLLRALPPRERWPVLMAARFSLSFPVLLSAVPMYVAVERGRVAGDVAFDARKVYFSDGGITSNCPVHLFDAPIPGYPTFGVNLYQRPAGSRRRVTRSDTRDPEVETQSTRDAAAWTTPLPFLLAIFSTLFGWRDSLQRRLPGYRERIVHVGVPEGAGGLNLAMSPRTIHRLARLGQAAAARLHRDFSTPRRAGEPNAWQRHRWTRLRTTLSALRAYLAAFDDRVDTGDPDYRRLLCTTTPLHDPLDSDAARAQALALVDGSRALARELARCTPADALARHTPQPAPALRLNPPW